MITKGFIKENQIELPTTTGYHMYIPVENIPVTSYKVIILGILVYCTISLLLINSTIYSYDLLQDNNRLTYEYKLSMNHNYNLTNENQILTYYLSESNRTIDELRQEISYMDIQYDQLEARKKLEYHIPTTQEISSILRNDKTDTLSYDVDTFDCTEFTNKVIDVFEKNGIVSCFTELEYTINGHALIAVNTTEGIYYIEPQKDKIMKNIPTYYDGNNIKSVSSCYGFEIRY